jgi:hypothetical protein
MTRGGRSDSTQRAGWVAECPQRQQNESRALSCKQIANSFTTSGRHDWRCGKCNGSCRHAERYVPRFAAKRYWLLAKGSRLVLLFELIRHEWIGVASVPPNKSIGSSFQQRLSTRPTINNANAGKQCSRRQSGLGPRKPVAEES